MRFKTTAKEATEILGFTNQARQIYLGENNEFKWVRFDNGIQITETK